jgi:hypothetical protein
MEYCKEESMKKTIIILWVIILLLLPSVCFAKENHKITPIKGIILVCKYNDPEYCDLSIIHTLVNLSPIKFLTRSHLKKIFDEQTLQLSGLTDIEKTKVAGRLLGASHILVYSYRYKSECSILHEFELININTSELEYAEETNEFFGTCRKLAEKKDKFDLGDFFKIINKQAAKP